MRQKVATALMGWELLSPSVLSSLPFYLLYIPTAIAAFIISVVIPSSNGNCMTDDGKDIGGKDNNDPMITVAMAMGNITRKMAKAATKTPIQRYFITNEK